MAQLEYFIVAESHAIDQQTNRVSLFNVVEQLNAVGFPVVVPQLVAVSAWNAEPGDDQADFQAGLRVTSPDGSTRDFSHNFKFSGRRCRTIMTFQLMQVAQAGTLILGLSLNGRHEASHTIEIIEAEQDDPND